MKCYSYDMYYNNILLFFYTAAIMIYVFYFMCFRIYINNQCYILCILYICFFYKPQRLTNSNTLVGFLRDVLYADDCAFCAISHSDMQHAVGFLPGLAKIVSSTISVKNIQVMYQQTYFK